MPSKYFSIGVYKYHQWGGGMTADLIFFTLSKLQIYFKTGGVPGVIKVLYRTRSVPSKVRSKVMSDLK